MPRSLRSLRALRPRARLRRRRGPTVQSRVEATPALARGQSRRGRPLFPALVLLTSLGGWLAWLALLYRGRIVAQAAAVAGCPAGRVWEIFQDIDRWPEWRPAIVEAGWLGRERWQPGARFRWTIHGLRIVSTIVATRANSEVAWEHPIWGHAGRFGWRFADRGSATGIEAQIEFSGWSVWLLAPWLQMSLNRTVRQWVDALVARAETMDHGRQTT